jgi:hypothetical protein
MAAVDWSGLVPGSYQFWVKLDSGGVIGEAPGDGDNIGTAVFSADNRPLYSLDIQVASEGGGFGGVVSKEPDLPAYLEGQTVTLTAAPASGWHFAGWSGDAAGPQPAIDLVMDSDKTIQATFARTSYRINTAVSGSGSVQITPQKDSYPYGEWVMLNAVADRGWRFAGWSGTIAGTRSLLYLNVTRSESITANFVKLVPNVTDETYLPISARP